MLGGAAGLNVSGCNTSLASANRFIMKLRTDTTASIPEDESQEEDSILEAMERNKVQAQSLLQTISPDSHHTLDHIHENTYSVQLQPGEDIRQVMADLKVKDDIEYVEPDYLVQANPVSGIQALSDDLVFAGATFNDPLASRQWGHRNIESEKAWDLGQGGEVVVGVIDSGVDYRHPDLATNMWRNPGEIAGNGQDDDSNGKIDDVYGWDFANNDASPISDDGSTYHGTHVAGTIGAVGGNAVGITGHSPQVKIMALKFLDSSGSGLTSNAVKALDYAVAHGAKIVSNSWGGFNYSQAMADSIARARAKGVLFVAAAGNSANNNDRRAFYPANYAYDNVVSVAATDSSDRLASFSHYGVKTVHIGAPGVNIYSTKNGSSYQSLSGTSMAAPLVSGVAALMWAKRQDLSYRQIKNAMFGSADQLSSLNGKVSSGGRVNAYKAMMAINSGSISDVIQPPPPSLGQDPKVANPCP